MAHWLQWHTSMRTEKRSHAACWVRAIVSVNLMVMHGRTHAQDSVAPALLDVRCSMHVSYDDQNVARDNQTVAWDNQNAAGAGCRSASLCSTRPLLSQSDGLRGHKYLHYSEGHNYLEPVPTLEPSIQYHGYFAGLDDSGVISMLAP